MKKLGLILIFLFISSNIYSQSIKTKLLSKNIGMYFDCNYYEKIDLATNDTTYFLSCTFQNMEYSTIVDIGSIFCSNTSCIEDLWISFKKINELYNQNPEIEYEVNAGMCRIRLANKNVWIYDDNKYTYLTPKLFVQYSNWLEEVVNLIHERELKKYK